MKPENILQSNLLDIIFEDRNKAYGAYNLRKEYNHRLGKALAITFTIVCLFAASEYIKANYFKDKTSLTPLLVKDIVLQQGPIEPKDKPKEPKAKAAANPKATAAVTPPVIVPDELADKPLPDISDLKDKLVGKENIDGEPTGPGEIAPPESNGTKQGSIVTNPAKEEEPEIKGPISFAEVMPEFPGGMEAFKKFLLRNLRQPDLDEGAKVVVRVRFVVGSDGSIQDVNIEQSGGELDKEVLRVVGKMPHWKPGMQNGRSVAVYFSLPVTFVSENQP